MYAALAVQEINTGVAIKIESKIIINSNIIAGQEKSRRARIKIESKLKFV